MLTAMPTTYEQLDKEHAELLKENAALLGKVERAREALSGLLKSADASWENGDTNGHDWPAACHFARQALKDIL